MKKSGRLYLVFSFCMSMAPNDPVALPHALSVLLIITGTAAWIWKIVSETYTIKERIWQAGLLGLGVMSGYFGGHLGPLLCVMVMLGLKDVRVRCVLGMMVGIEAFAFLIHGKDLLMSFAGGEAPGYYENRRVFGLWNISDQYRHFWGSLHPDEAQKILCCASVIGCCINRKKLKVWHIAVITLVNVGVYFLTLCNTGIMVWLLSAAILVYLIKIKTVPDAVLAAGPYLYLTMVAAVLIISALYEPDNAFMAFVNRAVTGRIRWAHDYLYATGLSLWGRSLSTEVIYKGLDCGYMNFLLNYGCILFVLYVAGVFCAIKKLAREKRYEDLLIICFLQLYFTVESFMLVIWMNAAYLYISEVLFMPNHRQMEESLGEGYKDKRRYSMPE